MSLGGSSQHEASLGKIIGPAFSQEEIPGVVHKLIEVFKANRHGDEEFLATYQRIGIEPFKEKVYAKAD